MRGAESYVPRVNGRPDIAKIPLTIQEVNQMAKTIAVVNQKGGVGKTATTMNLGAGLSREGYDVLLVDLDAQANLTMAAGYQNPDELKYTVSDVLRNAAEEELTNPAAGILKGPDGVELLPANIQLSMQEPALINVYGREALLAQFIDAVQMEYDYTESAMVEHRLIIRMRML